MTTPTNTNPFNKQGNIARLTSSAVDTSVNLFELADTLSSAANHLATAAAINARSYARNEAVKAIAKEAELIEYAKQQGINITLEDIDKYLASL